MLADGSTVTIPHRPRYTDPPSAREPCTVRTRANLTGKDRTRGQGEISGEACTHPLSGGCLQDVVNTQLTRASVQDPFGVNPLESGNTAHYWLGRDE